jgi:hypothetical protein
MITPVRKGQRRSVRVPGEGAGYISRPAPTDGLLVRTEDGDVVWLPVKDIKRALVQLGHK